MQIADTLIMDMRSLLKIFEDAQEEEGSIRILNWLYLLRSKKISITFHYQEKEYNSFLHDIDKREILIWVDGLQETNEREVFLTLEIMNRYYFTEVSLLRREKELYVLSYPKVLRYVSRRLYPRLEADSIPVYFFTIYTPVTLSRLEENSLRNYFPDLYKEAVKDDPSLPIIFQILRESLRKNSQDFSMRLFIQEAKMQEIILDEKENVLVEEKKSFYIENVLRLSAYFENLNSEHLINFSSQYQEMLPKEGEIKTLLHFENIKRKDSNKFLLSYVLSPLKLFDQLIGYMKLQSSQFERKIFSPEEADTLHYMAELFSHAITKISIRQSYYNIKKPRAHVINISMSGMLIKINNLILFEYMKKSRRIKIKFFLHSQELELFGEIKRFFIQDDAQYLGVLFFNSRAGDMAKLEDFIYHANLQNLASELELRS